MLSLYIHIVSDSIEYSQHTREHVAPILTMYSRMQGVVTVIYHYSFLKYDEMLKFHIFASIKMIPCKFHGWIFTLICNGICMERCAVYEMLMFNI